MKKKPLVVCCYWLMIEPKCDESLRGLEKAGYTVIRQPTSANIDYARSLALTLFYGLESFDGHDALLFIDSDVSFSLADVEKLCSAPSDLDVVCGIYPQKGKKAIAAFPLATPDILLFGERGGLHDIAGAGMGFTLIRRHCAARLASVLPQWEVLEREGFPCPFVVPFFLPGGFAYDGRERPVYLGEDYAFCTRVRQAGGRVVADTRILLGHVGRYEYTLEDLFSPERSKALNYEVVIAK